MTQTAIRSEIDNAPVFSGSDIEHQPENERVLPYQLDVGVAEIATAGDIAIVQDDTQHLYSIIEGKRYIINEAGQREVAMDSKDAEITDLASDVMTDFWSRSDQSQLTVAEAKRLMSNSIEMVGDMLDAYDNQAKNARHAKSAYDPSIESNFSSMTMRFFEDTDGNLRAVYGRVGKSSLKQKESIKGQINSLIPSKSESDWQPVDIGVTPPLKGNERFMLSSEDVLDAIESLQFKEQLGIIYNAMPSMEIAADKVMDISDLTTINHAVKQDGRAVVFIDVAKTAIVSPDKVQPISTHIAKAAETPQSSFLSRISVANTMAALHELRSKPRHKRARFSGIGNIALSSQVMLAESMKKVGDYYKDEEKGRRRKYITAAGALVLAGLAALETKGIFMSHHLNDTHQQAVNHLHGSTNHDTQATGHTKLKHPAKPVVPATKPAETQEIVSAPPVEVPLNTYTISASDGSVWSIAAHLLTNPSNPNPGNTEIYYKTLSILNANHISLEQARYLQAGTVLTIPS